jgi:hypothetical protein
MNVRKVLVTPELFTETFARTADGRLLSCEWGEPDADGFYSPTFTATDDGEYGRLRRIEEAARAFLGTAALERMTKAPDYIAAKRALRAALLPTPELEKS